MSTISWNELQDLLATDAKPSPAEDPQQANAALRLVCFYSPAIPASVAEATKLASATSLFPAIRNMHTHSVCVRSADDVRQAMMTWGIIAFPAFIFFHNGAPVKLIRSLRDPSIVLEGFFDPRDVASVAIYIQSMAKGGTDRRGIRIDI